MLVRQEAHPCRAARHAENAKALRGEAQYLASKRLALFWSEMTEIGDGLGRALRGHHDDVVAPAAPRVTHGQQARRERVLALQRPAWMQMLCVLDEAVASLVKRTLHRIERVALARQDRVLEEAMQLLRQVPGETGEVRGPTADGKLAQRHLVLREGARLVDAEHGGGSQHLDRRHPTREHTAARQSPRSERKEDREHDRELLGQDGHRHRDAGEEPLLPRVRTATAGERKGHHHHAASPESGDREKADDAPSLGLQHRRLGLRLLEGPADLAKLRPWARGCDFDDALARGHQGSREHGGQVVATRSIEGASSSGRHFANGDRLARQQRLVSGKVQRLPEQTIRRDAITFGKDHEVAGYNLTPRDAPALAVTDHESARAREIAERLERMLRASGLDDRDRHHHEHEAEQHQCVGRLPEEKVHDARRDEHEEHGLAHHLEDDGEQVAFLLRRELVRSVLIQTRARIHLVKAD